MEKYDLTFAVIGRNRAVEYSGGLCFQRLDYSLNKKLANIFKRLVVIPIVYGPNSLWYATFSQFYKDDSLIGNAVNFPVYDYTSYKVKSQLLKKLLAWKNGTKTIIKAMRMSDAALIYMPSVMGLTGIFACLLLRKPYMAYFGSDWSNPNPRTGDVKDLTLLDNLTRRIKSVMQQIAYSIAPVVLIRDKTAVDRLSKRRKAVFYIPGNSEITEEHLYLRDHSCQNKETICLTVSSLIPLKGIPDIIRAIAKLRGNKDNIKLWHVGGSYPDNLQEARTLCVNLAIEENVTFHGYINDIEKLLELYRKADIFILASHSEGFPRVIIEAMSQSLPVIATDIPSIRGRLRDKYNCLLVKPADRDALGRAIIEIINNRDLRKRLVLNGYKLATKELQGNSAAEIIARTLETYILKLKSCNHSDE